MQIRRANISSFAFFMSNLSQAYSLRDLVRNSENREQKLKVAKMRILSDYLF